MEGQDTMVEGSLPCFPTGLTHQEALDILSQELSSELESFLQEQKNSKRSYLSHVFNHGNSKSVYHWTSVALLLLLAGSLLVAYGVCKYRETDEEASLCNPWWIIQCCLIFIFICINVTISIWNWKLEKREITHITKLTLDKLAECVQQSVNWQEYHFPDLHSPISPSLTLQWTIRDGTVVNLPYPLLVRGDIILLRPSQKIPADCQLVKPNEDSEQSGEDFLSEGTLFFPRKKCSGDEQLAAQGKQPYVPGKYQVLQTPFVKHLRTMLRDDFERPVSIINRMRFSLATQCIERRLFPIVLVVVLLSNILQYMYWRGTSGSLVEMLLVQPVNTLLPLLPVTFPLIWMFLNFYGLARVLTVFQVAKDCQETSEDSFSSDSTISEKEARVVMDMKMVGQWFWRVLRGTTPRSVRRSNLCHTLASVTSFCCVDKKGLLSWANPTAEKVFFLSNRDKGQSQKEAEAEKNVDNKVQKTIKLKDDGKHCMESPSHVEVMDLTHDNKLHHDHHDVCPIEVPETVFGLHFDDPSWTCHLNSLKPLGLNILLNTCSEDTVSWYTQFTDHIACEALENEETVAVVNRRCLCDLAKQIGFSERAVDIFQLEKILGMFKHVHPDESAKERLHRLKSFVHHKIPMPNVVSVVVKEVTSGMRQVLSQGTADLLLSCCSDFWNGEDVCTLTESDKKKILDFYHRTSMASYCTSFSYRPLSQNFSSRLQEQYIQLSRDCADLQQDSGNNTPRDSELDMTLTSQKLTDSSRAFSVDSLFDTTSLSSIDDIAGCFQTQNNQVFIGSVSMQYQARQDFVQLIDKLEVACIRFVHFSQENEVRSRVFSEKMGLEAGWNCHISLLSDKNWRGDSQSNAVSCQDMNVKPGSGMSSRHSSDNKDTHNLPVFKHSEDTINTRSFSAPSIVNLDSVQVRFEMCPNSSRLNGFEEQDEEERRPLNEEVFLADHGLEESNNMLTTVSGHEIEPVVTDTDLMAESSDSRHASSYFTENTDSLTGALDNRAKLPRGIQNIRPHLKNVDNVPLLVNLFTDCTPETTQEMMKIMQENDEVVLCLGSSMNVDNISIFMQADASFSVEPLFPQLCARKPAHGDSWHSDHMTPTQLAASLISIPCPLSFRRDDNIGIVKLIAEARSFLMCMRNCFYLMMCFNLGVTLAQLLGSVLLFPPLLSSHHLLWVLYITIPIISVSLMAIPVDSRVMNNATTYSTHFLKKEVVVQFICYFLVRFVPSIFISILCYGLSLHSFCQQHNQNLYNCSLFMIGQSNMTEILWPQRYGCGLVFSQNIFTFALVLHYVFISISFVYWSDHIWQQVPTTNRIWTLVCVLIVIFQIIYFVCDVHVRCSDTAGAMALEDLHPAVFVLVLVSPFLIVVINELVKRREVKLYVRYQKRTRLNFGTKLGMNSPF